MTSAAVRAAEEGSGGHWCASCGAHFRAHEPARCPAATVLREEKFPGVFARGNGVCLVVVERFCTSCGGLRPAGERTEDGCALCAGLCTTCDFLDACRWSRKPGQAALAAALERHDRMQSSFARLVAKHPLAYGVGQLSKSENGEDIVLRWTVQAGHVPALELALVEARVRMRGEWPFETAPDVWEGLERAVVAGTRAWEAMVQALPPEAGMLRPRGV